MKGMTRLFASILGGILVTLSTGLVNSTPPMLVGATHYGYPFPWLYRLIIAPQYNPWKVDPLNFFADVIVWSVVVALVLFALTRARK